MGRWVGDRNDEGRLTVKEADVDANGAYLCGECVTRTRVREVTRGVSVGDESKKNLDLHDWDVHGNDSKSAASLVLLFRSCHSSCSAANLETC